MLRKQRRIIAGFWCDQVDAGADSEAEAKFDDGGVRAQGRREEEEEMKR